MNETNGPLPYKHMQQEQLASAEIQAAMQTIVATEQHIAEQLGLSPDAAELPGLADEALVHVAERTIDEARERLEFRDAVEAAVETALIAGALETTGQRPEQPHNPILDLESDGYGDAVTEAVSELHGKQAALPDGQPAAETVAQTIESAEDKLAAIIAEATGMSHDPDLRHQATDRNSQITPVDIWQPGTLHHVTNVKALANILRDGQLSTHVDPAWRTLRMPVRSTLADRSENCRLRQVTHSTWIT